MNTILLGRKNEIQRINGYCSSPKSEFIAVYGRRRVGKTYLIKQHFKNEFTFYHTGLANANTKEQLINFGISLKKYFKNEDIETPKDWLTAILLLIENVEKSTDKKKIIFLDELPWMDTKNSSFLTAIEYFWNSWADSRKDVKLIICGSAASWIINKLLNNKGGLHNRITGKIKLHPFTLKETKQFLESKGCIYDTYQYIQAYMALGGIPYYLEQINNQLSIAQNINNLCFGEGAFFANEYNQLFKSLFTNYEKHVAVINIIATKNKGCSREEIVTQLKMNDGGSISKILLELEESNFIRKYPSWQKKSRESLYQLIDSFSLFHLKFMKDASKLDDNFWLSSINTPAYLTWAGYAFEIVCIQHLKEIKAALGISGILTTSSAWYTKEAQIDLIIDRSDRIINVIEIKFSNAAYLITKKYDDVLRNKIDAFRKNSKTKKTIWLTMLTTYGLANGPHNGTVQNSIMMDALFV
jgi:uncharacterized protein